MVKTEIAQHYESVLINPWIFNNEDWREMVDKLLDGHLHDA